MARFMARYLSKVDGKGRASVPAPFRAAIESEETSRRFYLRPNATFNALDGLTEAYMRTIEQRVEEYEIGSIKRLEIEEEFFADTVPMEYDGDGRVVLPRELMEKAGITDAVRFVGLGSYFQLWEPEAYERHRATLTKGNALPKPGTRPEAAS